MATMREIKRRKSSIQSTQQITNAMKLVSTVKLQKSRAKAENTRPYFDLTYSTVCSILAHTQNVRHPYLQKGVSDKQAVIAITSNRGLAGGYNSNIVKEVTANLEPGRVKLYAIGRKGRDALVRRGYGIARDYSDVIEEPSYADAAAIGRAVLEAFQSGEVGEIYLAYTSFKNTVSHEPRLIKLLPIELSEEELAAGQAGSGDRECPMNYDGDEEEVLNALIPGYVYNLIYGGMLESIASENGARMQAMDSATSNAEEMIDKLSLQYNRARQSSITQELTEIIAGAEALN
ncbi:ATP synthase F1 subunit gamma [Qiania dongpingensis]|uniref:ATP synthase gamma chain n=1 Tax=Qiania dongpingensis TaxID=2763669 RepID=A0A7G9G1I6_9FIRM|nr:ATP synthase F1 subunit gamma [Qiania dongpingensis]QNM04668.1 ATP synthase F1 subunit gamma [Qiania dongpingensis]